MCLSAHIVSAIAKGDTFILKRYIGPNKLIERPARMKATRPHRQPQHQNVKQASTMLDLKASSSGTTACVCWPGLNINTCCDCCTGCTAGGSGITVAAVAASVDGAGRVGYTPYDGGFLLPSTSVVSILATVKSSEPQT